MQKYLVANILMFLPSNLTEFKCSANLYQISFLLYGMDSLSHV